MVHKNRSKFKFGVELSSDNNEFKFLDKFVPMRINTPTALEKKRLEVNRNKKKMANRKKSGKSFSQTTSKNLTATVAPNTPIQIP